MPIVLRASKRAGKSSHDVFYAIGATTILGIWIALLATFLKGQSRTDCAATFQQL